MQMIYNNDDVLNYYWLLAAKTPHTGAQPFEPSIIDA